MEGLAVYDSSGDEDARASDPEEQADPEQSVTVVSKLKERIPIESAPYVPVKVCRCALIRTFTLLSALTCRKHSRH